LDGVGVEADQDDPTRDHSSTYDNSKKYGCEMCKDRCGYKRRCPGDGTNDTKTHPDYDFHLDSSTNSSDGGNAWAMILLDRLIFDQ
jgi:hypothetical protein